MHFPKGEIIQTKHPGCTSFKSWQKEEKKIPLYSSPYLDCNIERKETAIGLWLILFVSTVQPRSNTLPVPNGSTDCDRFVSSTLPCTRPFIHPCFTALSSERSKTRGRERKKSVFGAELSPIPPKQKLTLIPGTQWSQPPLHPWGRQQIIPIMQHVCYCRNPPWPYLPSLRGTGPETWCQAAAYHANLEKPHLGTRHPLFWCSHSAFWAARGVFCAVSWQSRSVPFRSEVNLLSTSV